MCGWTPSDKFYTWMMFPHYVSIDVFLDYKLGRISSNKFHMRKIFSQYVSIDVFLNYQLGRISSNKFHKWKISPQSVSVYVFLNGQLGWIFWNKFYKWKISLIRCQWMSSPGASARGGARGPWPPPWKLAGIYFLVHNIFVSWKLWILQYFLEHETICVVLQLLYFRFRS